MSRLFAFGFGYSAQTLAPRLAGRGWTIAGTARDESKRDALRAQGFDAAPFSGDAPHPGIDRILKGTTHLLHSIPPSRQDDASHGDHVLTHYGEVLTQLPTLQWVGYLSTVGVYGDQQGDWVSEDTPPKPNSARTEARVLAEQAWLDFGAKTGVPVHIFRLAGIYGPGRSVFDKLAAGTARRINKQGQVFSRIHVADDEPAAPGDIVAYAARMIGVEPPPEIDFDEADLSPMVRSFYEGSRKIGNARIKSDLGVKLRYPTFREGLAALKP
jgi:nucleoside-diphosphate-sugar epimerase